MNALADSCLAASLSPRESEAIHLRYGDGCDLAAMAERMGCSEDAARVALGRGERRLAAWLSETRRKAEDDAAWKAYVRATILLRQAEAETAGV